MPSGTLALADHPDHPCSSPSQSYHSDMKLSALVQERLSAAERRAYAVQKERDSLKRQVDKLNALNDVIRERDSTIQQASLLLASIKLLASSSHSQRATTSARLLCQVPVSLSTCSVYAEQ